MDDSTFDALIERAGAVPPVRSSLVLQLAEEARARRRRRRPLVVGTAVVAPLLLAAAAGTAAWMGIPPFQGLPAGTYRTQSSIAIDYRSATGHENHCRAFLEFTHLTVRQADAADALVRRHDWSGLGQRAYDAAATGGTDPAAVESGFTDELDRRLQAVATRALPDIAPSGVDAGGQPAWSGFAMSCEGGQR